METKLPSETKDLPSAFWLDASEVREKIHNAIKSDGFVPKMVTILKETLKNDEFVKQQIAESVQRSGSLHDAVHEQRSIRNLRALSYREENRLINRIIAEVEDNVVDCFSDRIEHILSEDLTHPVSRMLRDRIQSKTESQYKVFSREDILKCFPPSMIADSPEEGLNFDKESVCRQKRKRQTMETPPDPLSPGEEDKSQELYTSALYDGYLQGYQERCARMSPEKIEPQQQSIKAPRDERLSNKWKDRRKWHRS